MIPRLYIPGLTTGEKPNLDREQLNYLRNVLRLKAGDDLVVFSGDGFDYRYRIESIDKNADLELMERTANLADPRFSITLIQAALKGDKVSEVVRNITPLGVGSIIVCRSKRSVGDLSPSKSKRWTKIASEQSRQCGRSTVPEIVAESSETFCQVLEKQKFNSNDIAIVFWEQEGISFSQVEFDTTRECRVFIAVGPEGGLTEEEIETAVRAGWQTVHLGKTVLRADIFPTVAMALVQNRLGEL